MNGALYLEDSYLKECSATVLSANEREVVLDQTVFYPRGGGQPSDSGKIIKDSTEFRVISVFKKDGKIVHDVDSPGLSEGDTVRCMIDWTRRYRLMRMHTAAHVLGATMHNELGVLISGNQLEEDKARFDFTMESFDRSTFEDIVAKANNAIEKGAEIKVYSMQREEAMKIPGIVKLAGALPPDIMILRIVEIPGVDIQADGGTHVKSLSEVGKITILRLDNKGKANRRIYFTLSG